MSSLDGGNVDIDVRLGTDKLKSDSARAKQEIRGVGEEATRSGVTINRGMARAALGIGAASIAAHVLSANLAELGKTNIAAARASGFLQELGQGNIIGAIRAAQQEVKLTDEEMQRLGTDSSITAGQLDKAVASLDAIGQSDAASKIREIRNEMVALQAVEFAGRGFNVTVVGGANVALPRGTRPDDIGGLQGPGLAAAINAQTTTSSHALRVGLTQQHLTAIAGARALTPGNPADDVAQLRRAQRFLLQQLESGAVTTEKARKVVFEQLTAVQNEIKALTKKPESNAGAIAELRLENRRARAALTERLDDDRAAVQAQIDYYKGLVARTKGLERAQAEAKLVAKQVELQNLRPEPDLEFQRVNAASLLGPLGQGPFLTSPVFRFAESFGFKPRPRDFLRDIRQQVQQGARFQRQLDLLERRGLSESAVGELAGQGLAASDIVNALARAPRTLIRQFSRQAELREQVAQRIQVTATQVELRATNVVIQGDRVVGIDRNGNGALDPRERFATTAQGR